MDILPPPAERLARSAPPTAEQIAASGERTHPHFPSRDFAHGRGWGVPTFGSAAGPRSAGVVCVLATADGGPKDWVNAGQALQRVLLTSATCGVAAALRSQPLELPRRITGADPLELASEDVALEGANSSFQVHLRVDPADFTRTYNAARSDFRPGGLGTDRRRVAARHAGRRQATL